MNDSSRGSDELIKEIESLASHARGRIVEYKPAGRDVGDSKRDEQELVKKATLLDKLIDLNPYGISIFDTSGRCVRMNQACLDLYKGPMPPPDYCLFEDPVLKKAGYSEELQKLKDGDIIRISELWYNIHDVLPFVADNPVCVSSVVFPVMDERGELEHVIVMHEDITQRKLAEKAVEEALEQHRSIFENTVIGLYRTTPDGRILAANPALVRMLGYSSFGELARRNLEDEGFAADGSRAEFKRLMEEQEEIVGLESRWIRRDGSKLFVRESSRVIRDTGGNILFYEGTVEDITDRKKAEDALKESEEKFRTLAEQSPNMIFINRGGRIVYVNHRFEEVMGYSREELCSEEFDFMVTIAPESRGVVSEYFKEHMRGRDVAPYEYALVSSGGRRIEAILTSRLISYGGETAILGTITDITERKRAERAIRRSEEKYRTMVEDSEQGVTLIKNGCMVFANRAAERMLGYGLDELSKFSPEETKALIHPDDRERVVKHMEARLSGQASAEQLEYRILRKDGKIRWVSVTASLSGSNEDFTIQTYNTDITDRKRAEEALRDSEARLKSIFRVAPVGIGVVSNRVLMEVNDRVCEMLGYSRSELIGKSARMLYSTAEDYEYVGREKYDQIRRSGTGTVETKWVRKDGEKIDVLLSSTPLDIDDYTAGVTFTVLDISERCRAEDELRKSEKHYRMLAETMNDGLTQIDERGYYTYANERLGEIFGCSIDEIVGKHWTELFDKGAQSVIEVQLQSRKGGGTKPYEVSTTRPDGRVVHVLVSPQPIFDERERYGGSLSILTDITELKQAEEKARQHQSELAHVWRINTMGEMASGLAHELNQPLCAISNYANACIRMMKAGSGKSEKIVEAVEQIASQAGRAGEIIRRIRSLVAKRKLHTSMMDINEVINEVVEMEKAEAGQKGITVRTELAKDLPKILADSVEIEEVILNLVRNAFDAMSDRKLKQREVCIQTRLWERVFVEVCVSDTGKGVDAADIEHVFDSFFSTKKDGMGIGLSISRTIIETHGGRIWAESNPDCGASFRFTLPIKESGSKVESGLSAGRGR
ncbi:MAG: PAS domain S-box protein [Sedimentisphaerales bacterium]|nr:PAS domain S-box protein [Sedimentisphaerales bacterium]